VIVMFLPEKEDLALGKEGGDSSRARGNNSGGEGKVNGAEAAPSGERGATQKT